MANNPREPAPLSADQWAELVEPLRRYAPRRSFVTWERDLRQGVEAVIALFADKETPFFEWMNGALPLVELVFSNAVRDAVPEVTLSNAASQTRRMVRRFVDLTKAFPHFLSARDEKQPRRATTLEALREVDSHAAKLCDALNAAILDPWLNVNMFAEVLRAGLRERFAKVLVGSRPQGASQGDETVLTDTRESLHVGLVHVEDIRQVAQRGIALLQRKQLRGRPSEASARMPAILLSAVVKHHVPAPPRGDVEHWRSLLADFIREVLLETGLMKRVSHDFIETTLR
jgi:hypothetical protein